MGSPDIRELLPPPVPAARPFPWKPVLAVFVPAAAVAAGTGLQRMVEPSSDPILQWLCFSSAAGLLVGFAAGFALKRRIAWAAYGLLTPWIAAALVWGTVRAVRPLREAAADRREASCRAAGRAVCTQQEFTSRCEQAQKDFARAESLLGKPHMSSCTALGCTTEWIYPGPYRPEQYSGPGGLACFVVTDAQRLGVRRWLMPVELP